MTIKKSQNFLQPFLFFLFYNFLNRYLTTESNTIALSIVTMISPILNMTIIVIYKIFIIKNPTITPNTKVIIDFIILFFYLYSLLSLIRVLDEEKK